MEYLLMKKYKLTWEVIGRYVDPEVAKAMKDHLEAIFPEETYVIDVDDGGKH